MKLFARCRKTRLEQVMQRVAAYEGECTIAASMAAFYASQLEGVDHNAEWWRFAELKQKHHDAVNDQTHYARMADEARAKMEAIRNG